MNSKIKWLYLAVGTLLLMLVGLIYAWSIFRVPLSKLFPDWSATQISTVFTISMFAFCIFGMISGKLILKVKSSTVIRVASLMLFCGFAAITLLLDADAPPKSLIILNLFYGILCGGGVGLTYNSIIGTVTKWFPNNPGMASGTLLMGFGVGGIVLGSIVNGFSETVGIQLTFVIIGAIIAILLFVGSFFIKNPPWWGDTMDEDSDSESDSLTDGKLQHVNDYKFSEMIRTPTAWIFFVCITCLGTCGLIIVNIAAVVAVSFGAPAVMGLVVSVFNGIGRVLNGSIYDRFGRPFAVYGASILMIVAGSILLLGSWTDSLLFIFIGLPLTGLAFGGTPSLITGVTHEFFGPKYFSVNYSFMTFNLAPAAIIGPMISSKLQDASNGSFDGTFVMIIALGAAALLLAFAFAWCAKKEGIIKATMPK